MIIKITPTVGLILFVSCVPLGTLPTSSEQPTTVVNKTLLFEDKNYEDYVGNVIVNSTNPFIKLGNSGPITLEFDLLTSKFENLQARLIHCNFDWKQSQLRDIEYMSAFNRFDHLRFDYSSNTKTAYIQYFFEVGMPNVSGNYLLVLSRRNNPNDVLFSRRLVVYEERIAIDAEIRLPRQVRDRRTHQQLDFSIQYGNLTIANPQRDIQTIVMQNKNWHDAIVNLEPTNISTATNEMEWFYFDGSNQFPGWNQFRWLDLRTLVTRGMGIAKIQAMDTYMKVYQGIDSQHGADSYRQLINDNNGRYIPGNSDPGEPWLEADYSQVIFTLKSDVDMGPIFITGRFNDWQKNDQNKMKYYPEVGAYEGAIRLKQGYYDYRYEVESGKFDRYYFEGSHFQAENEYDILIYYRAPGRVNDQVIGYQSLNSVDFI